MIPLHLVSEILGLVRMIAKGQEEQAALKAAFLARKEAQRLAVRKWYKEQKKTRRS